jgi:hypothetical protein
MALMVLASIKSHTLASLAKNKYIVRSCTVPVGVFEPRWLPVQYRPVRVPAPPGVFLPVNYGRSARV